MRDAPSVEGRPDRADGRPSFERTQSRLEEQVEDGLFTRGAQLAVEISGERLLDVAIGDCGTGTPMSPEHVIRVYCTIKPVTVLAVARLVEQGVVSLDEPLDALLPDMQVLAGGVTLRNVLTHTAGLHFPGGVEMEMVPAARRRAIIARTERPADWRLGVDAAYSEYAAWHILGWLLESVTGEPLRQHLRREVLDPLDLRSTWVGMTPDQYRAALSRLGVNVDMRNLGGFPMLFERGERVCTETNPAHGGYTNARDLARLYTALLATLADRDGPHVVSSSTLQLFCSPARATTYDLILQRECSYGLGFMTDLRDHAFGSRCGATSFGHSGNLGNSLAFADPARELTVGLVFNGLVGHEAAFMRREALINELYADLDELSAPMPDPVQARNGKRARPRVRLGRRSRQ
jgi:CubicO group peptidase (beta-lactamase class C family)